MFVLKIFNFSIGTPWQTDYHFLSFPGLIKNLARDNLNLNFSGKGFPKSGRNELRPCLIIWLYSFDFKYFIQSLPRSRKKLWASITSLTLIGALPENLISSVALRS